jgi:hypothetical protein
MRKAAYDRAAFFAFGIIERLIEARFWKSLAWQWQCLTGSD